MFKRHLNAEVSVLLFFAVAAMLLFAIAAVSLIGDKPAPPAPVGQACGAYTLSGPGGAEWAVTICPADKKP